MAVELRIIPVLNGFIVHAGCQILVYDNPEKIKLDFSEWVNDPEKVEKRYRELMEKKGICPATPAAPPGEQCQVGSVAGLRPRDELVRNPIR